MQVFKVIENLRWQHNRLLLVFYLAFVGIFISLGIWQLSRAEQKRTWLAQRDSSTPQFDFVDNLAFVNPQEFSQISLRGQFAADQAWLLQNQRVNNQLGYDLIAPFQPQQGPAILVNLGWQPTADITSWLANIGDTIAIHGKLRTPMDLPFVSNIFSTGKDSLVEITPGDFPYPNLEKRWYLQISPEHPLAQVTHWQNKTISPEKHRAYAVQWFAMALVLTAAFIIATTNITQLCRSTRRQT